MQSPREPIATLPDVSENPGGEGVWGAVRCRKASLVAAVSQTVANLFATKYSEHAILGMQPRGFRPFPCPRPESMAVAMYPQPACAAPASCPVLRTPGGGTTTGAQPERPLPLGRSNKLQLQNGVLQPTVSLGLDHDRLGPPPVWEGGIAYVGRLLATSHPQMASEPPADLEHATLKSRTFDAPSRGGSTGQQ